MNETNTNMLDIEELKKELENSTSFYKEATNSIDLNGSKAELVVSVSKDIEDPDIVRLRVAGNIPIPIAGGDPIVARLDRETVMSKEAFMALDANGLRDNIQNTVFHGDNLSKEDIEKRNNDKAFSMFADLGAKFDNLLENSKDSVLKYFDSVKPTVDAAKENLERSKAGQGFMKAADYIKSGQERVVGIGKNVGKAFSNAGKAVVDSYQRANMSFDEAMAQQVKDNEVVNNVKNDLEASEKRLDELKTEIDELGTALGKMTAGIEQQGFITPDQKARIDLMKDILQEKMTECVAQRDTIEQCEKTLDELKQSGIEYASPMDAAFKAKRDSYFKDISAAYGVAKQAVMAEYEVGKKALSSMIDTIKDANEKAKTQGKVAYHNLEGRLSNIGTAGLTMMQAMEVKTADFLRDKAVSLTEKYQYRAEVRASAKNLLNTILRKETNSQPLLTDREVGMIKRMADLADKMEARSEKTAERAQEALGVNKTVEKTYAMDGEKGWTVKVEEPNKDVKAWEPKKVDEDKKVEVNKLREDLER